MLKTLTTLAAAATLAIGMLVTGAHHANAMNPGKNIVAVAEHVGGFSTLVAAIKAA